MLLRTEFIEIRWAQVSSLEVTWAFALLSPDVVAVWRCYGCRWRFAVVGLLIGFVAAATGLPLSFCLVSQSPLPVHRCVLQRSGLLLPGQNQHGEHDNDGGSDCQRGAVGNVQRGDAYEHAGAVGNEPDEPHANAQAMEVVALFAIAAQQNVGRPGCVEEHERDDEAAGDGVQARHGCRSEMEPPLLWAMELMMAVPVESHARPIQKKMRCERFSVPELRSPKTPIV